MNQLTLRGLGLVFAAAISASVVEAQRQPHAALKQFAGFTDAELRAMERGEVVSKVLEAEDTEVAVIGVIWIDASVERFVTLQKDIENFEASDAVLAIQKISTLPRLSDFSKLTFPTEDLDDLAECSVGDCPVKADDIAIDTLHAKVNWKAPDAHGMANRVIRQLLLDAMQEYIQGGNRALGAYRDKTRPLFIAKEFEGLIENSPYVLYYDPELHDYLARFPDSELEGVEDFFYWSKVKFGLKPVVRVSHVAIYPIERGPGAEYAIASKMLYASHYFHTGLELKYLVKDTAKPDGNGFYLISVNRSRSDGLTGFFGGIVRSRAESGARDGLAVALEEARKALGAARSQTKP